MYTAKITHTTKLTSKRMVLTRWGVRDPIENLIKAMVSLLRKMHRHKNM